MLLRLHVYMYVDGLVMLPNKDFNLNLDLHCLYVYMCTHISVADQMWQNDCYNQINMDVFSLFCKQEI